MAGPPLVCANFDGASVMQGRIGSAVAHILQELSEAIPKQFIAHTLDLLILDSVKSIPFIKNTCMRMFFPQKQ